MVIFHSYVKLPEGIILWAESSISHTCPYHPVAATDHVVLKMLSFLRSSQLEQEPQTCFLGRKGDSQAAWMSRTGGKLFDNHILNHSVGLVYADGPFTGPQIGVGVGWGGVGWGGVWYHSSVLQDMMWCYATHGVGWGGLWYHSSVLQDMMWCYATHGVGWGGLWYHSSVLQDMMRCDATHGVGWGGVWYHSFPSPRQTQWFVVQVHSKSTMEMGTHWLRLADRNWRSCKISHAVKRKGHFVRSSGFAAQNPVRVANHSKADVFFDGRLPHEIALAPQRNNNFWTIMGRCQVRRVVYVYNIYMYTYIYML